MQINSKKLVMLLLAFVMVFSIVPNIAFAAEGKLYEGLEKDSALPIKQIGRYDSGALNKDGGSAEIISYNPANKTAYVVNGTKGTVDVVSIEALKDGPNADIKGSEIKLKELIESEVSGFDYGDATSVVVSPDGKILAAAVQSNDYDKNGFVVIFNIIEDGKLDYEKHVEVGVQPDMVTFSEDGKYILSANEGEPREGYAEASVDPAGSVSVIKVEDFSVKTIGFEKFDDEKDALAKAGVVMKKDAKPSTDFEPEYIEVVGDKAFVALQEANAIGILDLGALTWDGVFPLGFVDHSKVKIDLDKDNKKFEAKTYENLYGIRMPDGIAAVEIDGASYILTANEGDGREWGDEEAGTLYINEIEGKTSPSGKIEMADDVVWYDPSDYVGLKEGADYIFGGRSFTMYKYADGKFTEVFSSGSEFEEVTAKHFPEYFNASNDKIKVDNRSGKKGPEPESVVVGKVDGKLYAFVALERIGGVMVYDITNPAKVEYVNYINSRDFSEDIKDDVSPEGLAFVDGKDSPTGNPLLLVSYEVSGTVGVYELNGEINKEPKEEVKEEKPKEEESKGNETKEEPKEEKPEVEEVQEEKPKSDKKEPGVLMIVL